MSGPGDDTLRESQAPGADSSSVDSFRAPGAAVRATAASDEVRESQRAAERPEVRPPVSGGSGAGVAGESVSAGDAGSGWPADPGPGERVDHGGCTVADAIRSAMARRS
ncbi:hypothetical protein [Amycolatopsis circi]|uniref:hypothetical protein n=1 Tax=Amycolatopsis circi TaxID=871959 RepID=UPI0013BE8F41|nr:hypothetical protein [Amycolatopsis circi]